MNYTEDNRDIPGLEPVRPSRVIYPATATEPARETITRAVKAALAGEKVEVHLPRGALLGDDGAKLGPASISDPRSEALSRAMRLP